jgi:8-hydroxy-5-deazaflavin:NADPH oxidoreductase
MPAAGSRPFRQRACHERGFPQSAACMKIAIIGAGNVGGALGKAWAKAGHSIIFGVRNPGQGKTQPPLAEIGTAASAVLVPDAVRSAEVVVLATPWNAVPDAINAMGDLKGKTLIDCTNPLSLNAEGSLSLSVGSTSSGAEQVEQLAKGAHVVKAFNTYGWENFVDAGYPNAAGLKPVMFYCGDDDAAKERVARLAADIGFEPVDTGGLGMARSLEPLALLWIRLAVRDGRNPNFTWARLRR